MSDSDDTSAPDTEVGAPDTEVGAEAPGTVIYAWSQEADDHPAQVGKYRLLRTEVLRRLRPDGRIVPAIIAAIAVLAVAQAGVLVLTPPSPTRHYSIAQAPLIEKPAPQPPAAPKPAPPRAAAAAKPPVAPPPPASPAPAPRRQPPPPVPAPLTPSDKFNETLQRDGMHSVGTPQQNDFYAEQLCRNLSEGGNPSDWAQGTEQRDRLGPGQGAEAVHAAIQAYCPQFG